MALMIDWVTVFVPLIHSIPINGGNVVSIDPDGIPEWTIEKRLSVEGSYSDKIQIRSEAGRFPHYSMVDGEKHYYYFEGSDFPCSHISISGNFVKFMQGHNVFGTDDLHGLITATLFKILPVVCPDLNLSSEFVSALAYCSRLTRIDITGMYDLGNQGRVLTWLRAAANSATLFHRGRGHFSGDTLYWGQRSTRWTLKMYAKGQELKVHKPKKPLLNHPLYFDPVIQFADKSLRVELTLRSKELDKIDLYSVQSWLDKKIYDVYSSYLSKLEFNMNVKFIESLPGVDDLPGMDKLKPRLIGVVQLWKEGHDVAQIYPRASFYRYRREIQDAIGLDISLAPPLNDNQKASNVIPLFNFMEAKPLAIPEWAKGTPLYFVPPKYPILNCRVGT